jgi:hypothetical protein
MQSTDERHVTHTDRGRAADIPGLGATRNRSRVTESIEQTLPHQTFEEVVLPHLDAAHNYARWLTKNDADALEEPS